MVLKPLSFGGAAVLALSTVCASAQSAAPPARTPAPPAKPKPVVMAGDVNAGAAATKAFQDRIKEYLAFHNRVEATVAPLDETAEPAKISARERALGEALIKARPTAQQGEFFIKEYQPYLRQIIEQDFKKRTLAQRKALIVELPKGVTVGLNMAYPSTIPLATFPPNLLKALPELPPELEYRIVSRDLILRDVKGNVVVDVMPNVFPIPA